jgi:hypothetical protein
MKMKMSNKCFTEIKTEKIIMQKPSQRRLFVLNYITIKFFLVFLLNILISGQQKSAEI